MIREAPDSMVLSRGTDLVDHHPEWEENKGPPGQGEENWRGGLCLGDVLSSTVRSFWVREHLGAAERLQAL